MNSLREGIIEYLELRRSLGFKLKKDERLLLDFANFMERRGATWITSRLALAWAQQPQSSTPNYLAGRLRAIRSFARYRRSTSHSIACATRQQWTCCMPGWSNPLPRYGWDMNPLKQPKSISMRIWR